MLDFVAVNRVNEQKTPAEMEESDTNRRGLYQAGKRLLQNRTLNPPAWQTMQFKSSDSGRVLPRCFRQPHIA